MNLEQILQFLDGRKVIIAGVIVTIASYLEATGVIESSLNVLIATLVTIIFGTASIQTRKVLGIRRR